MSEPAGETLANLLREVRRFPPPPELAAAANATAADYERADTDSQAFWATAAAGRRGEPSARRCHHPSPTAR